MGLAVRFLLRHLSALVRQHQPPGHDAGQQQQRQVGLDEAVTQRQQWQRQAVVGQVAQLLVVQQAENRAQQRHHHQHQQQVMAQAGVQVGPDTARQQPAQRRRPLRRQVRARLAQVAAARVQRAAQRTDGALVGRAEGHVRLLVVAVADHAAGNAGALQALLAAAAGIGLGVLRKQRARLARQVVAPAREPGQQRRADQGGDQRDHRRERACGLTPQPQVGRDRQKRGQQHRAHADRVDVVQVGALEFDAARRQTQRLADHQIGDHRHHPGDRYVGVQAQHVAQRLEHVHLHQHEGDQRVEHHPHYAPRMAVREPRKEIAPGQRASIGIGDVDLQLRQNHEKSRGPDRPAIAREHIFIGHQVHLVRVHGPVRRHHVADCQVGQKGAAQHLEHAQQHPARAAGQHRRIPAPARGLRHGRHEAQVVGLLAHLRDQRNAYRQRRTKGVQFKVGAAPVFAGIVRDRL